VPSALRLDSPEHRIYRISKKSEKSLIFSKLGISSTRYAQAKKRETK